MVLNVFDDVSSGGLDVEPGRYLVRVERLEPTEHAEFGPGLRWVLTLDSLATQPPTPLYQTDGTRFELWQTTSRKLTPRAKARRWLEAFLDRDLQERESGAELAQAVLGRRGVALIGPNERGYPTILQLAPYLETTITPSAPEPVGAVSPAPN